MTERTCPECHTSMRYKRADAKFCGTKCRVQSHRRGLYEIPAELKGMKRWVRRSSLKRPLMVGGLPASVTVPGHWSDFARAEASAVGAGLGFVLAGDGIGVIDLDHCLVDGKPTPAAAEFIKDYPESWIEVSQSGEGLHIWCKMEPARGSRVVTADGLHVETYSQGRYIALGSKVFQQGAII